MADSDLKINYIITAQDQASKILEKIDRAIGSLRGSLEQADKAFSITAKDQASKHLKSIDKLLDTLRGSVEQTDKDFVLTAKDQSTEVLSQIDNAVKVLGESVQQTNKATKNLTQATTDKLSDLTKTLIVFGATYASLVSTSTGIKLVIRTTDALFNSLNKLSSVIITTFGKKFPQGIQVADKAINFLQFGLIKVEAGLTRTNAAVVKDIASFKNATLTTRDFGKSLFEAFKVSEIYEKGLYGLITRLGLFSSIATTLGISLLKTDGAIAKVTGSLILFSVAVAGYGIYALQQLVLMTGTIVEALGTNLVNALNGTIETFINAQNEAQVFEYIINSLNENTQGATGSFEEWNDIVKEFATNMRFSISETQKSVSELLRVGNSLGLTKEQMQTLLPVIGELARVNHKDLFQSTLAVVEGLAGQTVMLQNMGVALTEAAVIEALHGKISAKRYRALSDNQKIQERYNVLLKKTQVIQGATAGTSETLKAALERQKIAIQNVSVALGKGASIIEAQFNSGLANTYELLQKLSQGSLTVLGFLGSLAGRFLQIIGVIIKFSFSIVLLTSTIKALNVLLANRSIQLFIANLAQSELITKRLAASFPILAETLRTGLLQMSYSGLTVNNAIQLILASLKKLAAVVTPILLVVAKFAAIGALVAGAIKLIIDVTVRVVSALNPFEKQIKALIKWFNEMGIVATISKFFNSLAVNAQVFYQQIIGITSSGLVKFLYSAKAAVLALRDVIPQIALNFKDKVKGGLTKVVDVAKSWLSINEANAGVIEDSKKKLDESNKSLLDGVDYTKKWNQYYRESDKYLDLINKKTQEEIEAIKKAANEQKKAIDNQKQQLEHAKEMLNVIKQLQETPSFKMQLDFSSSGVKNIYQQVQKDAIDAQEKLSKATLGSQEAQEYADELKTQLGTLGDLKLPVQISGAIGIVDSMTKGSQAFLSTLSKNIGAALGPVGAVIGEIIAQIIDVFGGAPEEFSKKIIDTISGIDDVIKNIIVNIANIPRTLITGIIEAIKGIPELFAQLADGIISALTTGDLIETLFATIAETIPKATEVILEKMPIILTKIFEMMSGIMAIKIIMGFLRNFPLIVKAFTNAVPEIIAEFTNQIPSITSELIKSIPDIVNEFIRLLPEVGKALGEAILNTLTGGLEKVVGKVKNPLSGIGDFFGGLFENGGIPAIIQNLPKAENGIIAGSSRSGDRVPVRVNSREMILNMQQQKELFNMIKNGFAGQQQKIYIEVPVKINERELGRANREIAINGWS